ncbi:hypothetical protein V9T40_000977 [Parthenolecanium corni]|uniref:Uncharacterized protein n=1 Tax=Parthenolecanium corni TaxID=536013 RepID=A0AAN9Y288_9HEMI
MPDSSDDEDVTMETSIPTQCDKHTFITPIVGYEDTWSRRKRMFLCEKFKVKDEPVAEFYLSAAGLRGAVLVFQPPENDKKMIRVIRMVTGLFYEEGKVKSEKTTEGSEKTSAKEDAEAKEETGEKEKD